MADRVVFDTNVIVSALLSRGPAYRAVLLAKAGVVLSIYCDPMLAELTRKLRTKFDFDQNHIEAVVYQIREYANRVEIKGNLHVIEEDPDDDKFVECAMVGEARWIVSSDKHLLAFKAFRGVSVVTPRAFLAQVESSEEE